MDDIVRTIYTAIKSEDHLSNTLFVLCGDHGMNEGGNHGGSSPGETSPALVFMSPKLTKITQNQTGTTSPAKPKTEGEFDYYRTIEQSDIAPTLAGLLGFPVPRNNLGVFLNEFLGFWDNSKSIEAVQVESEANEQDSERNQLLYRNARQIKQIVQATYDSQSFEDVETSHKHTGILECKHLSGGEKLACLWNQAVRRVTGDDSDVAKQQHFNKVRPSSC